MDIKSIILVPNPDFAHALLGDPNSLEWRLGSRPAVACRTYHGDGLHNPLGEGTADWRPNSGSIHGGELPRSLILMWDGEVVGSSFDRAYRARGPNHGDHGAGPLSKGSEIVTTILRAMLLEHRGIGKVLCLDSKHRVTELPEDLRGGA